MKFGKGNKQTDEWKRSFVSKLGDAKSKWSQRFSEVLDHTVTPVFTDLGEFLRNHDFSASRPMNDEGRHSFKFELAEDAYVLLLFRASGLGLFELHSECFAPGCKPVCEKARYRVVDVNDEWVDRVFRLALDTFVELLAGRKIGKKSADKKSDSADAESFEELLSV